MTSICILTATYQEDPLVISYWGRTPEGESIVVRVHNFKPYLVVRTKDLYPVRHHPAFVKAEPIDLKIPGKGLDGPQPMQRITVTIPKKVPEIRRIYEERDDEVYAGDILFPLRYMYDAGIGTYSSVPGEPRPGDEYGVDLVLDVPWDAPWTIHEDPFETEIHLLAWDIEAIGLHGDGDKPIICIGWSHWINNEFQDKGIVTGDTEKDVLLGFEALVKQINPDVIGAHYNEYDFEKIDESALRVLRRPIRISRDGSSLWMKRVNKGTGWQCRGRVCIDSHKEMQTVSIQIRYNPKEYGLNYLAGLILNDSKEEIDILDLDRIWVEDPQKVLNYCIHDAYLCGALLTESKAITQYLAMAEATGNPLDNVMGKTSGLIDGLVIPIADREGWAIPLNRYNQMTGKEDKIRGGVVIQPQPGLHRMTVVADFASLYPNTIITYNMCFTSIRTKPDSTTLTSPIGAHFDQEIDAIIPRIMKHMIAKRNHVRKVRMKPVNAKLKACKMIDNNQEPDSEESDYFVEIFNEIASLTMDARKEVFTINNKLYVFLDAVQYGIKAGGTNSFYGVLSSPFYRFTDRRIGESITQWARVRTEEVIEDIRAKGYTVVIGDTDSAYILSPYPDDLEKTIIWGEALAAEYSAEIKFEMEKIYNPLFQAEAKKRYVGKVIWPKEKMDVKGFELKRSDSFEFLTSTMKQVFENILDFRPEDALALVRRAVRDTLGGRIDRKRLVLSRGTSGLTEDDYARPDSMANVQAGRKMVLYGYTFIPGKVSWIVTDGGWKRNNKGKMVKKDTGIISEPIIEGWTFPKPDDYYYGLRLAMALGRITELWGWDAHDLIHGSIQSSLFDFKKRKRLSI